MELKGVGETVFAETKTDDFGDFIFEQIEGRPYEVVISKEGYELKIVVADATELGVSLGDIALVTA